jgi:enamine deaminase RidA (YjgF/YER057c/UK114 family)
MRESGFIPLLLSYQFVRLLKASKQTSVVQQAIDRLEKVFEEALAQIARYVDFNAFEVIDCDTLAKAQLGSGLIALNAVLETHANAATRRVIAGSETVCEVIGDGISSRLETKE